MTIPERPTDRPEASPEIVRASSQESLPERLDDSHDAPEGLPGDDDDHHPHAAFHEADWYGHGEDDRLVSDISERYPEPTSSKFSDQRRTNAPKNATQLRFPRRLQNGVRRTLGLEMYRNQKASAREPYVTFCKNLTTFLTIHDLFFRQYESLSSTT